jgi:bifunctional non-homologous end joining protein LigD
MLTEPGIGRLSFIEFQMPTLVEKPPQGDGWIHEIKYDGYRTQLIIQRGKAQAFTRRGFDWTDRYGPIVGAAAELKAKRAIIDGEATVLGATGLPDFQALRRELGKADSTKLIFHAFDLLHLNGKNLRDAPLLERKRALQRLLEGAPPVLIYVDHYEGDGPTVFEHACEMGLEGIVSKRADSRYRSGRQESWLKLKCIKSDNFPIVAFVEKLGAKPRRIASLYLGRREGNRVHYAGKAQSGYTLRDAREVRERLDPLIVAKSLLSEPIDKPKATWVHPAVEAEIQYSGITNDGLLREAVFKGLRDDLSPPARAPRLARKRPPSDESLGVPPENILQLLPDAVVPSKEDLIGYWTKIARKALVHLGRRPLKLVRHSHGVTFYHKGRLPKVPDAVHQLRVQKREGGEGVRLWVDDLDGLLGLVEMGVVELHPWNATIDDIEHADHLVIDLDPGEGVEWELVAGTALALRDMLRSAGLDSWPKVTGGKGVHVMAPLNAAITHDAARQYARRLAQQLVNKYPDRYVLAAAPSARVGRIFLDYLRNGRGNTAVGAYSPRAGPHFPIAAPVTWSQVEKGILPDAFTLQSPFRPTPQTSLRKAGRARANFSDRPT